MMQFDRFKVAVIALVAGTVVAQAEPNMPPRCQARPFCGNHVAECTQSGLCSLTRFGAVHIQEGCLAYQCINKIRIDGDQRILEEKKKEEEARRNSRFGLDPKTEQSKTDKVKPR
jgi:hypothetical protein